MASNRPMQHVVASAGLAPPWPTSPSAQAENPGDLPIFFSDPPDPEFRATKRRSSRELRIFDSKISRKVYGCASDLP